MQEHTMHAHTHNTPEFSEFFPSLRSDDPKTNSIQEIIRLVSRLKDKKQLPDDFLEAKEEKEKELWWRKNNAIPLWKKEFS